MNSDFDSSFSAQRPPASSACIDFAQARRLADHGATCEAYDARYLHRRVFVKKLRDTSSPTLRAAFAKEAEIGMNLSHPSLPVYRFFTDDYIVMDFIDGPTLAAMADAHDRWLGDPAYIRRIISELTDVIAYLHSLGVVHCDIKADNVIITAGTHRAVLIDLGEAYTAAIDGTPGDPAVYGLDPVCDVGNPDIDYHGLGAIVDRLAAAGAPCRQFAAFRRMCAGRGVDPSRLRAALDPTRRRRKWFAAAAITVAVSLSAGLFILMRPHPEVPVTQVTATAPTDPAVRTDTVYIERDAPAMAAPSAAADDPFEFRRTIDRELTHRFDSYHARVDSAEAIVAQGGLTHIQLSELLSEIFSLQNQLVTSACNEYKKRYPDIPASQIELAVYDSDAGQALYSRAGDFSNVIIAEINRISASPDQTAGRQHDQGSPQSSGQGHTPAARP